MKKILVLITCLSFVLAAQTDYMNPVSYSGVKKLGMGGTGVAVPDTRDSIFYNPAHIVDVSGHYAIPLIHSSWTAGSETMANINKLATSGDSSDVVAAYRTIIPSKVGVGAQTSGYWANDIASGNYLGVGMYTQGKVAAAVLNRLSPRFDAQGYFDLAFPTITYGQRLETSEGAYFNNVKVAATVKRITRSTLYDVNNRSEQASIELFNLLDPDNQGGINTRVGTAYGLDLGALSDIDTFIGPMKVGAAITNINTRFFGTQYENINSENAKTAKPYAQTVPVLGTVGLAMKASPFVTIPALDYVFPSATYALDYDFIAPEKSFFKRLHMGLEQSFFDKIMDVRLGLNQGYPTFGLNFNVYDIWHVGFTTYTEELGTEIGINPQSYYVFDAGFYW